MTDFKNLIEQATGKDLVKKRIKKALYCHLPGYQECPDFIAEALWQSIDASLPNELLLMALQALEGKHDGCNYLSYGVCNKCGTPVNEKTLTEIRERLEKESKNCGTPS